MISQNDRHILEKLDEIGGFTTRQIALDITGIGHRRSAEMRQRLLSLKARGLITELDDQKPVCWKRMPAGTLALSEPRW